MTQLSLLIFFKGDSGLFQDKLIKKLGTPLVTLGSKVPLKTRSSHTLYHENSFHDALSMIHLPGTYLLELTYSLVVTITG